MRHVMVCCCAAAALVACAKSDKDAAGSASATTAAVATQDSVPAAPAAKAIALSDVAGTWNMRAVPESGTDTAATVYVLTASADSTKWSMKFPGKTAPVTMRVVAVSGDSVVVDAGPYASVRRKGVQVNTQSVMRLQDGKIVGTTVAHYKTSGADSVLRLRTEGTKAP